jgi:hypothetical protein
MYTFSVKDGQKIAKIYKKGRGEDSFEGYLRLSSNNDEEEDEEEDEELMELIRNATLSKKEKRRLAEIINQKAKIRNEPIAKGIEHYFTKKKTELDLPANYYLKQMHIEVPGSERSTFYIPARSNSGKTTWIANYLDDYLDQFPNNEIYLFSGVPKDEPAFERFGKKVTVMDLEYFKENPITKAEELSDFKDSMCIFDDINSIPDLRTKKSVITLRDVILQCGRHENVSCMVTAHQALDRNLTSYPIKESDYFVTFPQANKQQTRSLLTKYADFSKQDVDRVMKVNSRWVEISRNNPTFVLYSSGAYLI